jgi:hypothetical protein
VYETEEGSIGEFEIGTRKVSYDGKNFIIVTPGANKDKKITGSKKNVVDYLKKGIYKK